MSTYRTYQVGPTGRLTLGETFQAEDDDAAVERARSKLQAGQGAEVWEWGRLVGRFSREHEYTAGG